MRIKAGKAEMVDCLGLDSWAERLSWSENEVGIFVFLDRRGHLIGGGRATGVRSGGSDDRGVEASRASRIANSRDAQFYPLCPSINQ